MRFSSTLLAVPLTLLSLSSSVSAKCHNPSVRKEWRSLSVRERTEWINAVKCLAKLPHDPKLRLTVNPTDIVPMNMTSSFYDDFVYTHMDLNHIIHNTGRFFPWHRFYLHNYEKALEEKCNFTGTNPYWDWSKDSKDVNGSAFFKDSNSKSGLGGFGSPDTDYAVQDGAFAPSSGFSLSYPTPHTLRRQFNLYPFNLSIPIFTEPLKQANATFTPEVLRKTIRGNVGNFTAFQFSVEGGETMHGAVHLMMGGDLGGDCPEGSPSSCQDGSPTFSANEPLFWMHHGMIDKVWFDWQHAHPSNARAFAGGSVQHLNSSEDIAKYPNGGPPMLTLNSTLPGDGIFPDGTIEDVLDTQDGILCYVYE